MIGGPGFIYVRIPRTASTSHTETLQAKYGAKLEWRGSQHAPAYEGPVRWKEEWEKRLTYGYIRNPWEWLVSMYNANLSLSPFYTEALPGGGSPDSRHRANMDFESWVMARRTTSIDWLTDHQGNVLVDEVRLFEDFIKESEFHLSGRKHAPYRDWYTPETAEHVASLGAREIEIGGYEF